MKRGGLCLILLIVSVWTATGQNETGFIQDSLAPAVKYGYRPERRTSGVFHTDMKTLRAKAWSPVGENDPIRFAMTLPGVSSGADGFSAFFARGGNLGNNLVTLDGVRIYGYSHLLGLTTALSPDAISSMDFCIGGFSGDQGNMTASHIRLLSPDSDYARFRSSLSASNTFVGASVSVPVVNEWSNNRKWIFVKKSYRSALKKAIGIVYVIAKTLSTMEESFTISLWDPQDTIPEIGITFYSNREGFREVELENINEYNCPFMRIIITPML